MVRAGLTYGLMVLLIHLSLTGIGQSHLFSEVNLNKTSVYKGEPVEVRISVYTSTWFTRGTDPGNIKVDGAFTVYFRSVSETQRIDGKTYAGVTMIYNVFPYENNDIVFPAISLQVETPDEGGFQGIKRTLKTKPKSIKVKPVPEGFSVSEWLVSQNVSVKENWSHNLNSIKVGDVVERRISRSVAGNVSGLIPPLEWDTIKGVSIYLGRSEVNDVRTRTSITAERSDGITYLFEREGEVIIPAMEISWWNPVQSRAYKRTLMERKIIVQPNADLGMLETIKDSLNVTKLSSETRESEKAPISILGLSVKQFIVVTVGFIAVLILLILGIVKLLKLYKRKNEAYRNSEKYYYAQIFKANSGEIVLNRMYKWLDRIDIPEPTFQCFNDLYGNQELVEDIKQLEKSIHAEAKLNKKAWDNARTQYIQSKRNNKHISETLWINP
jgi:hypothetical protein